MFPSLGLSRAAHFVLNRRTLAALVLPLAGCAATFVSVATAAATKPASSGKTAQVQPLSLVSEYTALNPYDPSWCLSEDDFHLRRWSGSLNGTFTATDQLCNESVDYYNGIWWNGGGIGFQAELYVVGTLSDMAITSPLGDSHHAVLVGSSTSKGITTRHYQLCYASSRSLSSGVGGAALPGGTWSVALSGEISNATYYVNAEMTSVSFQEEYCPASEQNLTP